MKAVAFIFLLILAVPVPGHLKAGDANEAIQKANAYYGEGRYPEAVELYQGIIQSGQVSEALFVNLANAYYLTDQAAEAIYFYEKCLLLFPGSDRARSNLRALKEEMNIDIIRVPDFILLRWWQRVSQALRPSGWFVLEILAACLLAGLVYLWKFSTHQKRKLNAVVMMVPALLLFVLLNGFGYSSDRMLHDAQTAVAMAHSGLYSGADERSESLREIKPGMHLRVTDEVGNWCKVVLVNKEQGWMPSDKLRRL